MTIASRSSIINHVFALVLSGGDRPTTEQLVEALLALGQDPDHPVCVYCGDRATDWDHLHPVVKGGGWTGWPSTIGNLVPACGPCNQRKQGKDWRTFVGDPESDQHRLLSAYESRIPYDPEAAKATLEEKAGPELEKFDDLRSQINTLLRQADALGKEIRNRLLTD